MFSKKLVNRHLVSRSLVVVLGALTLTFGVSCTDYLKGEKSKPEVIELNNSKLQCLEKLPQQIKDFSEGIAKDSDLGSGIGCMQEALTYFKERTVGSVKDGYTSQDMRSFFGKYFLKQNNVSPELANDLMRLKQALLGGSDRYISKGEIERLVDLLTEFKRELILVSPHVKNLTLRQSQFDEAQFNEAIKVFRTSLHRLFLKTELVRSEYSFNEAKSLFSGIADFVTGDQPFALYVQASDLLPLVENIKVILLGVDAQLLTANDWSRAVDVFVDLYHLLLKSGYTLRGVQTADARSTKHYTDLAQTLIQLLENSPRMQREGYILLKDIDTLVADVNSRGWLPIKVSNKSLQETYRVILARMLDSERRGDSRALFGLQLKHLKALKSELNSFALIQDFVNQVTAKMPVIPYKSLVGLAGLYKAEGKAQKISSDDVMEQKMLKAGWEHFVRLLAQPHPMHFDSSGRVTIRYSQNLVEYNWASLTRFNVMVSLSRLLVMGYADSGGPFETMSLLKDDSRKINGLAQWYADFDSLGVELKAFDPRSKNSGSRSFLEASLFTPAGDGDERLNVVESFEFVSILLSGGLGTSSLIQQSLDQSGCQLPEQRDVFDFAKYNEECAKRVLRREFHKYFSNLPNMAGWVRMLNQNDWDEFYGNLLAVARVSNPKEGMVEVADIRTAVMILHYTESLMTIYDADRSQALNSSEIRTASVRFMGFLRNMSPGTGDENLAAAFAYLVLKGEKPSAADVIGFRLKDSLFDTGQAHRGQILKVFRVLKDGLK